MGNQLIHLYAPNPGGVADYVDVCMAQDPGYGKLAIEKRTSSNAPLPEQCLLHYSGYGYAKRGAPLWLLNKAQTDRPCIKTLGIFFHELYAFGPPTGSAFWLSPMQRHIARRLAEVSDFWITNSEASGKWLCQFAGDKAHAVLPVFSNIGEMPAYAPERAPKIVVFGGAHLRAKTYRAAGDSLFAWAQKQGLVVHDIGPTICDPNISAILQREKVIQHGRLDSDTVSAHLEDALFGVVAYQADCVAKSGVFAAFCAHGVCPVLISKMYEPADGLIENQHYIAGISQFNLSLNDPKDIRREAWHWYQPHKVSAHAATLHSLLNGG